MIHKIFSTKKSARYATWGNLSEKTTYFWFVLHGSKMTCEQMLYKFSDFDPETHFVVAPEALNRFYANGFSGEVVASWMTKRDRLHEITDFSYYLSKLYHVYSNQLPNGTRKVLLGFSQGGTTMYRWLHARKISADMLIPYSCWIPEDIDLKVSKTKLNEMTTIYTYGAKDQFFKEDTHDKIIEVIKKNELDITFEEYDGNHRVDRTQLHKIFKKYIEIK
ncbi:alpha/beta hydrolase [Portibacter marinus]|uniref:alpha/beta hydrolase n=1 Tax=Portibacter marinus TaxID=2898660 RepID=UPI001F19150C|nr:dienelactone hydrolase family protein [Portibacter marinus]